MSLMVLLFLTVQMKSSQIKTVQMKTVQIKTVKMKTVQMITELINSIHYIVNESLLTGVFPTQLKQQLSAPH